MKIINFLILLFTLPPPLIPHCHLILPIRPCLHPHNRPAAAEEIGGEQYELGEREGLSGHDNGTIHNNQIDHGRGGGRRWLQQ